MINVDVYRFHPLSTLTVCQQPRSRGVSFCPGPHRLLAKSNCLRFVRHLAGTLPGAGAGKRVRLRGNGRRRNETMRGNERIKGEEERNGRYISRYRCLAVWNGSSFSESDASPLEELLNPRRFQQWRGSALGRPVLFPAICSRASRAPPSSLSDHKEAAIPRH